MPGVRHTCLTPAKTRPKERLANADDDSESFAMARTLRIEGADLVHHVTARSHTHAPAFPNDAARAFFLELVGEIATDLEWEIGSYAVLTTHYHLLLRTVHPNLGEGMRAVQGRYAARLNRARDSRGPVWRDRFHSRPVRSEAHVVRTAVYIDLNPVSAGIVDTPEGWEWSSYRANVGEVRPRTLHEPALVYRSLGAFPHEAPGVYRELVQARMEVAAAHRALQGSGTRA